MKTVIRNSYTPKIGDYCETIVVDKESESAYIFDCDGVFTELPQPVDVEKILEEAAAYTDEQVAPLAEKLDTIEEGAQVNVIEHVLKNGTELTITNKTVNVTVPTKTSDLTNDGSDGTDTYVESAALDDYYTKTETDTQIGYETSAREIADSGLQEQIDAIVASSDVVDIVGTYAALQAYDTSKLHDNDIIKVLTDETRDDATTYYRWDADTSTWGYIGAEGPFYTKAESDATFVPQTRTINGNALSSDITLTAADVHALPDSTVIPTVNDATLTIQKNGTAVQTFTANQASNAVANITVPTDTSDLTNGAGFITSADLPTKTSDLTNDGSDGTSTYVEADDMPTKTSDFTNDGSDGTSTYVEADELATVATTGDYDDLLNKPNIPTVNDATLTIQKNGTDVATFTANSASAATANITVPTDTSDLTNGAGFITTAALSNYYTKSETYSQQEVNSLINTLSIPTKTSDLSNDGSDGTSTYVEADDLAAVATTGDYDDLLNKPTIPSYSDFTGATSSTAGAHGLVPAPAAGDEGKFLQGDGTWATVTSGQTYTAGNGIDIDANNEISVDTTVVATQNDLSGKQDTLTAGDAIDITNNVISVDADSALDVSSTKPVQNSVVTAAINGKQDTLTAGSNIQINSNVISATDTTYSDFAGTDGQTAGTAGLVPAPATTDTDKYLKSDGTWATVQGGGSVTVTSTPATQYSGSSTTDAQSVQGVYLATHSDTDGISVPGGTLTANVGTTTGSAGSSKFCIAIGGGASTASSSTNGNGRIAIGRSATAEKQNAIAIGSYSTTGGQEALALGTMANGTKDGATAIGNNAWAAQYSVAVGGGYSGRIGPSSSPGSSDRMAAAISNYSTALGWNSRTLTNNNYSVALGAYARTSRASEVSIGDGSSDSNYGKRYLANVKDGVLATDAATVGQLPTAMTGASSSTAGTSGLVPAPAAGDEGKVLQGDGTWATIDTGLVEMSYGEANAWQKFIDAYNANKIVYCRASSNADPSSGSQTRKAFMAYVNNATTPTSVEFQYVRSVSSKTSSQPVDQVFVYTLTNASGGTWTVASRNMAPKLAAGTNATVSYSNGTYTVGATVPTKTSDLANDGSDGTSTYVEADDLASTLAGYQQELTAGDHIDITGTIISAEGYVHSENPASVVDPGQTVSGANITDGSIGFSKVDSTQFLKLQLTTTDPGEGSPLAANTLLGVYQ